ncbi:myelin protein zero-like protein 2 isoform X2 [Gambusia affinis]|uniref:myelin protein zero-like protein 2 isoform X2 n=1 Tax=Gambusia affinis TaxID=33528 RepID=UPI001CDC2521|nr:myelin protein zero-like protein 2 isoform X2 [Gambusia affinis]
MVTMFSLRQASLLFIQLLKMQNVFEVSATQMEVHKYMSVSSGDPVMFICNISENATTLVKWNYGRSYFAYSTALNRTFSNFSSERVKIDSNIPSKLSIFKAQHDDSGLYTCSVTDGGGFRNMAWNLVVSNKQGVYFSRYTFFILSFGTGLFICCIMLVVCLCKRNTSRNQTQDRRTFTSVQYNILNGVKAVPSPFHNTAIWRRTDKQDLEALLMSRGTMSTSHHSGND